MYTSWLIYVDSVSMHEESLIPPWNQKKKDSPFWYPCTHMMRPGRDTYRRNVQDASRDRDPLKSLESATERTRGS